MDHTGYWWIAGAFCFLASLITCWEILQHVKHNTNPQLRRYTIRIIGMVPVYGFQSWFGLGYPESALYFDLARDCYEALVIYSFFQLLVTWLGGEEKLIAILQRKDPQPHLFPFCCLRTWTMHSHPHELPPGAETPAAKQNSSGESSDRTVSIEVVERKRSLNSDDSSSEESERRRKTEAQREGLQSEVDEDQKERIASDDNLSPGSPSAQSPPEPSSSSSSSNASGTPLVSGYADDVYMSLPADGPTSSAPFDIDSHTSDFLLFTQIGTLQYCVCKPATSSVAFLLDIMGTYGDGEFNPDEGYPYLAFITNCSQVWAMYCLILFYHALSAELKPCKPISKFICVKAVVFFTFWQSVALTVLTRLGILHSTEDFSSGALQAAVQDFIICIEMMLAALAHHYAFNAKDFADPAHPAGRARLVRSLFEAANMTDVYYGDFKKMTKTMKKKKRAREKSMRVPLLEPLNPAASARNDRMQKDAPANGSARKSPQTSINATSAALTTTATPQFSAVVTASSANVSVNTQDWHGSTAAASASESGSVSVAEGVPFDPTAATELVSAPLAFDFIADASEGAVHSSDPDVLAVAQALSAAKAAHSDFAASDEPII